MGGEQLLQLDSEFQVQLSKRLKYGDLKKRIADCINQSKDSYQLEAPITEEDIRLWKFADNKEKLVEQCSLVSQSKDEDSRMTDDGQQTEVDPDVEENSNVEFPGESLEPFLKTGQNLEDDTLENSYLIVELKDRT